MNIKGKLVEIFDTVQVTETFKKREFIIEDNKNPEYPEYIKVELIQDKVSLLDSLNIGDEINAKINLSRSLIEMEQIDEARRLLEEVLKENLNSNDQSVANDLLESIK